MNVDRQEFEATRGKAPTNDRQNLTAIRQAAVSAEHLTSDPDWDKFLGYLQDALRANVAARDAFITDLVNPLVVNPDEIAKRRIAVLRLNERIDILSFVMTMPEQLKKLGEVAADRLAKLVEIEGVAQQ